MKQPTLSILTAAVVLTPLTALAQKIQRKSNTLNSPSSVPVDYPRFQINHNAYGEPLIPIAPPDPETKDRD